MEVHKAETGFVVYIQVRKHKTLETQSVTERMLRKGRERRNYASGKWVDLGSYMVAAWWVGRRYSGKESRLSYQRTNSFTFFFN